MKIVLKDIITVILAIQNIEINMIKIAILQMQSMSRKGNCWDNAPQESFFGHMKYGVDLSKCKTFEDAKIIIDDWIDYYNNERYQWNLAKLSPVEYYKYVIIGEYPLKFVKDKIYSF